MKKKGSNTHYVPKNFLEQVEAVYKKYQEMPPDFRVTFDLDYMIELERLKNLVLAVQKHYEEVRCEIKNLYKRKSEEEDEAVKSAILEEIEGNKVMQKIYRFTIERKSRKLFQMVLEFKRRHRAYTGDYCAEIFDAMPGRKRKPASKGDS